MRSPEGLLSLRGMNDPQGGESITARAPKRHERHPLLPFDAFAWSCDTCALSLEAQGAYLRLLAWSWINGPLPLDKRARGKILGVHGHVARRLWETLSCYFLETKDGFINKRLERDRAHPIKNRGNPSRFADIITPLKTSQTRDVSSTSPPSDLLPFSGPGGGASSGEDIEASFQASSGMGGSSRARRAPPPPPDLKPWKQEALEEATGLGVPPEWTDDLAEAWSTWLLFLVDAAPYRSKLPGLQRIRYHLGRVSFVLAKCDDRTAIGMIGDGISAGASGFPGWAVDKAMAGSVNGYVKKKSKSATLREETEEFLRNAQR